MSIFNFKPENVFRYSEKHSDLENDIIAIDVKLTDTGFTDKNNIIESRNFDEFKIMSVIGEHLQHTWKRLENFNIEDKVVYISTVGDNKGYVKFKFTQGMNPVLLKNFSNEIEKLYKSVAEFDICDILIDNEISPHLNIR